MARRISVTLDLDARKYIDSALSVEATTKAVDKSMTSLGKQVDETGRHMVEYSVTTKVAEHETASLGNAATKASLQLEGLDKRIKAAAPMSGVAGDAPAYFSGISTPLLAEHGDADTTIPYPAGAGTFAKAGPPKFFLTLIGGGHTPPYRGAPDPAATAVAHVTLDFFDRYLKNDQGALERLRHDADQPGVATLQEQVR